MELLIPVQIGDDSDGNHNEAMSRMHRVSRVAGAADSEDICSSLVLYVWNYSDKPLPCLRLPTLQPSAVGMPDITAQNMQCMKGILMFANILYMFSFYFLLALNICMYIHAPDLSLNYRQISFVCPYQVYGETIEQLLSLCWITGTSPTVYGCNTSPLLFFLL
ncbi:uncharacterized protein LOC124649531 isoform X3 [Lolium rigidum]|uniref:uncharacterized protein LOC124649531 isoform X3 n=1 Tax=Lolium rigidum TaxID=89674 RepID=UPI001F5E2F49|nr:uncharacterized protein LOC124649531 isoform X3 [Lolium rigidum]XP_047045097.1 uncharacterized protein LOC124649531 isoform X3 [Lolium rigidum]XP_047045098.1 uncharacterized protein LOC124649531 isoform X3 [Lolium rigidum]XP_047045099.1 uncharacterized protein LOC124649531 isoform X3 [Lolium rigidum]